MSHSKKSHRDTSVYDETLRFFGVVCFPDVFVCVIFCLFPNPDLFSIINSRQRGNCEAACSQSNGLNRHKSSPLLLFRYATTKKSEWKVTDTKGLFGVTRKWTERRVCLCSWKGHRKIKQNQRTMHTTSTMLSVWQEQYKGSKGNQALLWIVDGHSISQKDPTGLAQQNRYKSSIQTANQQ